LTEGHHADRRWDQRRWFGGWLYATIGAQGIHSVGDVLEPLRERRSSPTLRKRRVDEAPGDAGPQGWNKDIKSVQLYQGQQKWSEARRR